MTILKYDTAGRSEIWVQSNLSLLTGSEITIISDPDDNEPSITYSAKVIKVKELKMIITLPRRVAGHGYLRKSTQAVVNFIIDNILYEADAHYLADNNQTRELVITGEVRQTTRRYFVRLPFRVKAGYAPVSDFSIGQGRLAKITWKHASTLDISGGGLLIETRIQAPLRSYFIINLEIESFQDSLLLFGQVRWSGVSDLARHLYQCGVKFLPREEWRHHFSPNTISILPPIMKRFDGNKQNELDSFLRRNSGGSNKGVIDE